MSVDILRPCRRAAGSLLASLGMVIAIAATPAESAVIEGVEFPASIDASDDELALFGMGLLRYRVVFRGYVGALYLPEELFGELEGRSRSDLRSSNSGALAWDRGPDVPRALELRYFWAIKGNLFGEAADELLKRNLSTKELDAIQSRLDELNKLYRDVEEGDRYRLTYETGKGTTLSYNGKALGTIPGRDFADAYFSIWLGKDPISTAFRDQILEGR